MVTLELDQVSITQGRTPVLHDVSARFTTGCVIGVIGPNGAGKSTLIRALLGLIKPQSGCVRLNGKDLTTLSRKDIARSLAYLPQGQTLHWPLTVERVVALGRLPHLAPFSRICDTDSAMIEAAMERVDVAHLRTRIVTELSGGERARVMMARALAVGAPALIADEPLAALDPGHQLDVMGLLRVEAGLGRLVLVVLHDLSMASRYCDHVVLMDQGRIVANGTPEAVLCPALLAHVYGITSRTLSTPEGRIVLPLSRV